MSAGECPRNHVYLGMEGLLSSQGGWKGPEIDPEEEKRDQQQAGAAFD